MQPSSVQSFSYAHFAHQSTIFPAVHGPHVTKLIYHTEITLSIIIFFPISKTTFFVYIYHFHTFPFNHFAVRTLHFCVFYFPTPPLFRHLVFQSAGFRESSHVLSGTHLPESHTPKVPLHLSRQKENRHYGGFLYFFFIRKSDVQTAPRPAVSQQFFLYK